MATIGLSILNDLSIGLTPEGIVGKLFSFHNIAHFLHIQSRSYSEHEAMEELYKYLVEAKDDISEDLNGYTNGRLGKVVMDPLPVYDPLASVKLCDEIMSFSVELERFAHLNGYNGLEGDAQILGCAGAKTKYKLSLK